MWLCVQFVVFERPHFDSCDVTRCLLLVARFSKFPPLQAGSHGNSDIRCVCGSFARRKSLFQFETGWFSLGNS